MSNAQMKRLQEQWENALERASQEQTRRQEVDEDALNHAAGLAIKSGLRGGFWGMSDKTCPGQHCAS